MTDEPIRTEQTEMDLPIIPHDTGPGPVYNVFRRDREQNRKTDLISRHKRWLNSLQKEYPMPATPYRIGVYIRYFNQTKYEDYLEYHKEEFRDTIALCPMWTLVDFYVDHGNTAPNMENAPEWCRLLDDCFNGKVNLIVTQKVKSVSRDPQDLAFVARILAAQDHPVGIYFISEDIFTLASYYLEDLHETQFLPEGWQLLPDEEEKIPQLPGGNHVE